MVHPDPFSIFPPGLRIFAEIMLSLFALLSGWIAVDTRRALRQLVPQMPSWWPLRRLAINPDNAGWVWFYRIDGAIGFIAIVFILVRHWFLH